MKKSLAILALTTLLGACTTNQGTFTVLSKNVVDLSHFDISKADKIRNVKGRSSAYHILWGTFGETNPNIESAMDDAFKRVDGDLFVDAKVVSGGFSVLLFGQSWVEVSGDVVKTRR